VVAASAPAAGAVREAPGAGAGCGTRGEPRRRCAPTLGEIAESLESPRARARSQTAGETKAAPVRSLTTGELAELEAHAARVEWAADGGDGSAWSDDRPDHEQTQTLNLEWILRGPLLEALAAITWKPLDARREPLEQPENYSGAAA
jgi:hypothetical protein